MLCCHAAQTRPCACAYRTKSLQSWLPREAPIVDTAGVAKKNSQKLNGRPTNVYENKGPAWKNSPESGNVIEKKGTY
jgi:hypothetical protein